MFKGKSAVCTHGIMELSSAEHRFGANMPTIVQRVMGQINYSSTYNVIHSSQLTHGIQLTQRQRVRLKTSLTESSSQKLYDIAKKYRNALLYHRYDSSTRTVQAHLVAS